LLFELWLEGPIQRDEKDDLQTQLVVELLTLSEHANEPVSDAVHDHLNGENGVYSES
jgi:hypothetical protein